MFSGIEFPVKLIGSRQDQSNHSPSDDRNRIVDEVDFFSKNNNKRSHLRTDYDRFDDIQDHSKIIRMISPKKENSHGDEAPRPSSDVNVSYTCFCSSFS